MTNSIILGTIATVVGSIGYIPYIRDTFVRKTKPHVFSWFIWGLTNAIVFFVQVIRGAGPGSWATGMTAIVCFLILGIAWPHSEKNFKRIDWISLFLVFVGLALWGVTHDPLGAVILLTAVYVLGFVPTYRKAFHKPYEETMVQYFIASAKWLIAIFAIQSVTLTTTLFPIVLLCVNGLLGLMLVMRRHSLSKIVS